MPKKTTKATPKKGRPKKVKKTKKITPKKEVKKPKPKPLAKPTRYFEAVGRRKTAVARVRLFTRELRPPHQPPTKGGPLEKAFLVNDKPLETYFPTFDLQQIAEASLKKMKCLERFRVSAKVKGGGVRAQAEAIRHGAARALILFNSDFRKRLRGAGYLTRDARERERKKFGLKRARRAPQWQKR